MIRQKFNFKRLILRKEFFYIPGFGGCIVDAGNYGYSYASADRNRPILKCGQKGNYHESCCCKAVKIHKLDT